MSNLLDGLVGGVRTLYAGGVEQIFRTAIDFVDMAAVVTADRVRLTVAGLRGEPVSAATPAAGDLLAYDGSQWAPAAGGLVDAAPKSGYFLTHQADAALPASKYPIGAHGIVISSQTETVTIAMPAGTVGQVLWYGDGWQAANHIYLPAGDTRYFTVDAPVADGNGNDTVFAGGEATGDGNGGDAIVRAGLLAATITEAVNGSVRLQTADSGTVLQVSGTAAAPTLGFFGATPAARPSFDRGDHSPLDQIAILLEALNDLGLIDFTGSYPG